MKYALSYLIIVMLIGCDQRGDTNSKDKGVNAVSVKDVLRVPDNMKTVIDNSEFIVYSNDVDICINSKIDNSFFIVESLDYRHRLLSDIVFDSPGVLNFNRWLNPHVGFHVEVDCFDKKVIITRSFYDSFTRYNK